MNTKTNLIGARLCGVPVEVYGKSVFRSTGGGTTCGIFSISNKADRMDVVEALGEKHGIGITYSVTYYHWTFEHVFDGWCGNLYDSHEEATRAALESLADIYLKEGEG